MAGVFSKQMVGGQSTYVHLAFLPVSWWSAEGQPDTSFCHISFLHPVYHTVYAYQREVQSE